jgi:hypothetical protein
LAFVESPTTIFFYLLMRDHVPTGTVASLIEKATAERPASAPTRFTAPELQALAERYAAELGMLESGAEAEEAVQPPTPGEAPRRQKARPTYDKILAALGDRGIRDRIGDTAGWMTVAQLVQFTGAKTQTVRNQLQLAVKKGDAEAKGSTKNRRYRSSGGNETSEPDHDDAGEGVSPDDPAGDTEERDHDGDSGKIPSEPGREDHGSDGGGRESGSVAPAALHPRPTDLVLMALIGDFIAEAGAEVWPGELESHFQIDGRKRKSMIDLLLARHRIEVLGAGPSTRYIKRGLTPDDAATDEDAPEGRGFNAKNPVEQTGPPEITDELIARFKKWASRQRSFKRRNVEDAFPDEPLGTAGALCARMASEGFLERRDGGGGTGASHFAVVGVATGHESEAPLEGQVMARLQGDTYGCEELAGHFRVPEEEMRQILGKLYREGMIRTGRSNGQVSYVPV